MFKKLSLALIVIMFVTGFLFAAGQQEATSEEVVIAIHVEPDHKMFDVGRMVKEIVEEETEGRLTVTLLGAEVGGERDHLEGVKSGEYDIALGGSVTLTLYAPEFAAPDIPFVYPSTEAARKLYAGEIGDLMNEALIKNGNMRLIATSIRNPRNLTANKPIRNPQELNGVKLRVPEIESWVKIWSSMGAIATPIAWPEVYTSLQTGVIGAQENPVDQIWNGRIYEVNDYLMQTEHVYSFFHWVINNDFYTGLNDVDKNILLSAVEKATAWGDEQVVGGAKDLLEKLTNEYGMTVVETDNDAFRAKAENAIKEVAASFHPEVENYVLSFIE
jgi:tripartite ATP-independent transporter DctP family solute receptor